MTRQPDPAPSSSDAAASSDEAARGFARLSTTRDRVGRPIPSDGDDGETTFVSLTRSLVDEVSVSPEPPGHERIMTDLVEYFVVVVRDAESLASMVPALAEVVGRNAIRILDLVAVTTDANGVARIIEVDDIDGFEELRRRSAPRSVACSAATTSTWCRWPSHPTASPSSSSSRTGGRSRFRLPHDSVVGRCSPASGSPEAASRRRSPACVRRGRTSSVDRTQTARDRIPDLLTRPPLLRWQVTTSWPHPLVDPVQQLEALADLLRRGLLSRRGVRASEAEDRLRVISAPVPPARSLVSAMRWAGPRSSIEPVLRLPRDC